MGTVRGKTYPSGHNYISSIQCDNLVIFKLWAVFFNRHSTTMNPMEEKERRQIPTMQASRDVHSNSSSILLNTTCISPSAGPTGSRPQSVVNLIKVLKCMWFLLGAQWLSGRVLDSRPKGRGFEPHLRQCVVVLEQDT